MPQPKTIAYLRVSTTEQDLEKNKFDILQLANEKGLGQGIEKNVASSGYKLGFRQLVILNTVSDAQTITYTYDAISRVDTAKYYAGTNLSAVPFREYDYNFDEAGNRLSELLILNDGQPTVTALTYNAANQISNSGFAYDPNGNLIDDGPNTYLWDRANRLMSMGGVSYGYDGLGNRIRQTVSSVVTTYLNDVQPGLVNMIGRTTSSNTDYFVHGLHGVHGMENAAGVWSWALHDGLNSVRSEVNNTQEVLGIRHFGGYGDVFGAMGSFGLPFVFTGEPRDGNDLQYHRSRYLNSFLGVFTSYDIIEGFSGKPLSLNRYSWVEGQIVNSIDPTGFIRWDDKDESGKFLIVQYDCLSCVAQEAGLFDLENWNTAIVDSSANPETLISIGYRQFKDEIVNRSPDVINENYIQYGIGRETRMYVPNSILVIDGCGNVGFLENIHQRGLSNQGRCLCRRDCVQDICASSLPNIDPNADEPCDRIFTPGNEKTIGIELVNVGLQVGLGGGFSGMMMFDINDIGINARRVIVGTLYAGLGFSAEIQLDNLRRLFTQGLFSITRDLSTGGLPGGQLNIVVSEASLDQLTGVTGSAEIGFLGYLGAEISIPPVGSRDCQLVTARGGVRPSAGVALNVNVSDVIYDSQVGRGWFPNSAWLHDILN